MSKLARLRRAIADQFAEALRAALKERFPDLKVETEWGIISMRLVTRPTNQKRFTKEQHTFIAGFSAGYTSAKEQIK